MPNEPRWLTLDDVVGINRDEVRHSGEPFLVLRPDLLAGALARPENLWRYEANEDIVALVVRLLFAIASAHAFEQGNKRTAWFACGVFLEVNGHRLVAPDSTAFAALMVEVIERTRTEREFVELLRPFVVPIEDAAGP